MNAPHEHPPLVALPERLDDAAAAALIAFLHEAARVLECHYAGHLTRHPHRPDPRQQAFWDDDPPF